MIDDKKIKDVAKLHAEKSYISEYFQACYKDGFIDCAKWMQEEFLKNLWHPASEKPNIKQGECCVTCLIKFKNGSTELCVYFHNPEGWVCDDMAPKDFKRNFNGWIYIDELLPRREVNND